MTNFQFQESSFKIKSNLDCFSILITISDITVRKTIVLLYIFVFVLFLSFSFNASNTERKGILDGAITVTHLA